MVIYGGGADGELLGLAEGNVAGQTELLNGF